MPQLGICGAMTGIHPLSQILAAPELSVAAVATVKIALMPCC